MCKIKKTISNLSGGYNIRWLRNLNLKKDIQIGYQLAKNFKTPQFPVKTNASLVKYVFPFQFPP